MRNKFIKHSADTFETYELLEMLRDEGEEKTFAYIRSLKDGGRKHG